MNGKLIYVHGLKELIKNALLPKDIYRFNAITVKILMAFFTEIKKNPKIHMEPTKDPNNPSNIKKEQRWMNHTS